MQLVSLEETKCKDQTIWSCFSMEVMKMNRQLLRTSKVLNNTSLVEKLAASNYKLLYHILHSIYS